MRIINSNHALQKTFQEICSIQFPEDALKFDYGPDDIKVEDISLEKEYNGVTVSVKAHLGTAIIPFSMDIGFGDIVIPEPKAIEYPLLLDDMPKVYICIYLRNCSCREVRNYDR